jgi:hypothetical protein
MSYLGTVLADLRRHEQALDTAGMHWSATARAVDAFRQAHARSVIDRAAGRVAEPSATEHHRED